MIVRLILTVAFAVLCNAPLSAGESNMLYFVTGKGPEDSGIYRAEFDPETGKFGKLELARKTQASASIAFSPDGKYVYTCGTSNIKIEKGSSACAYRIQDDGALELLNELTTGGAGPCYIETTADGKFALVANYSGGSAIAYSIADDGSLEKQIFFEQYEGASKADPKRQEKAHAHQFREIPGTDTLVVNDLGTDKIMVYHLDRKAKTITPAKTPYISTKPGDGPRHIDFLKLKSHIVCYGLNELASTLTTYHLRDGKLEVGMTVPMLPADYKKQNTAAEVRVHPNGKFVYATNRGHNSIAVYSVDPETGELTFVEREPTGGDHCRHFQFDPTRKFMLVANQNGGPIVVKTISDKDGSLTDTGETLDLNGVGCSRFRPE